MATWTITIGPAVKTVTGWSWSPNVVMPTGIGASVAVRLTSFVLRKSSPYSGRLSLQTSGGVDEIATAVENFASAIVVRAGNLVLKLPGPNHSSNAQRDATEPYRWEPSTANKALVDAFLTAYDALSGAEKAATTLTLRDAYPAPALSITYDKSSVVEGQNTGYTITPSFAPEVALTVNIAVTQAGDYISGVAPTTATLAANATSQKVTIPTKKKPGFGGPGTITVTLSAGTGYTISARNAATVNIKDALVNEDAKPVLVEITLKNASGADVPVYLSASFRDMTIGGKTYRQLCTPDALSPIRRGITSVGGIAEESPIGLTLVNAFSSGPLYSPETHTYIGQPVVIYRKLPTGDLQELYRGLIERYFESPQKLRLDISSQLPQRFEAVPVDDLFLLKDFPFAPREILDSPIPLLFGHWHTLETNTGFDGSEHYLAKVTLVNFSTAKGVIARNIKFIDAAINFVYISNDLTITSLGYTKPPNSEVYDIKFPLHLLNDRRILTQVEISDINKARAPKRGYSYNNAENAPWRFSDIAKYTDATRPSFLPASVTGEGWTSPKPTTADTDLFSWYQSAQQNKAYLKMDVNIQCQNNQPTPAATKFAFFAVILNPDISYASIPYQRYYQAYFYYTQIEQNLIQGSLNTRNIRFLGHLTQPPTGTAWQTWHQIYNNKPYNKFVIHADLVIDPSGTNKNFLQNLNWVLSGSISLEDSTYQNQYSRSYTRQEVLNRTFAPCRGFRDNKDSRYPDGGAVNYTGLDLRVPVDVLQALLRDKQIGMGKSIAELDIPAFAQVRSESDQVLDFQLFSQMTPEDISDMCREANIHIITKDNKITPVLHPRGDAPHVFTLKDEHILINESTQTPSIEIQSTDPRELANEFFFRYGYNPITEKYERYIIKSHNYVHKGTGNLTASTGTLQDTNSSVNFTTTGLKIGDTLCFPSIGLSTKIKKITANTLTITDTITANHNNVEYFSGPHFNYDCYLSALQNFKKGTGQRYERSREKENIDTIVFKSGKIESKYIRDNNTMYAHLQTLMERYTLQLDRMTIDTTSVVEQLREGDIIKVNSNHISATRRAKRWLIESIETVPVRETCRLELIERRLAKDPFFTLAKPKIQDPRFLDATKWTMPSGGRFVTLSGDNHSAKTAAEVNLNVSTFPAIVSESIDISPTKSYLFNIDVKRETGDRPFRVRAFFKTSANAAIPGPKTLVAANIFAAAGTWENWRINFGHGQTLTIPSNAAKVQFYIEGPGTSPGAGTAKTMYHYSNVQLLERG